MERISLVIPVFNEEENISLLYEEILATLEPMNISFEIIFVDDKSTDSSVRVINELVKKDDHVHGYALRCNTHKSGALQLGFQYAKGDVIITLDADLQDDPKEIPKLLACLEEDTDVVIAWRKERKDSFDKLLSSKCINFLANLALGQKFHDMNCGFKAYRREAADSIPFHGSLFRFIPHILQRAGFTVKEVPVCHHKRQFGQSKFTVRHRMRSIFDICTVFFLVKYGERPLHFFGVLGFAIFSVGFSLSVYLFSIWIQGQGVGGRPLLFLAVLFIILGMQIASIGLIGELLIYMQGQGRKPVPHKKI